MFVELMPLLAGGTVLIIVARVGCKAYQENVPLNHLRNERVACSPSWTGMADLLLLDSP